VGVAGEIHIGGDGLALGYLHRPELTAEKFICNPFSAEPGARLYKTGDLGRYLPDGNIEFLGRIDDQIKVRGFRIELGEIESVLSQHSSVKEAVVILREDEQGDNRLVGYVVASQEPATTTSELRGFLQRKLPEYMVPSAFVFLDSLPVNPNGKIDRRALPAPDRSRPELETTFVAPQTVAEEILAEIWSDVLGIEKVGVHDNFFDIGGHSLLMVKVHTKLRTAFGRQLSMIELFRYPTIGALAAYLSNGLGPELTPESVNRGKRQRTVLQERQSYLQANTQRVRANFQSQ
jgi:acyl carrier protein